MNTSAGLAERAGRSPRGYGGAPQPAPWPAVVIHVATLAAAFLGWLHLDRHLWFYGDEWDFLVRRGLFHAQLSIWAPHNEQWSTLPILLWRGIFSIVHLQHYWPYLAALMVAHVAVLHLLWRRGRREGVDVWVLSAFVLLMAFLGSGAGDLDWAFQVGFLGSLALGLLALDLLDRPAPTRAADAVAVLAVVAALMCSNVGVAMLVAAGVLVLIRRGWREAVGIVVLPVAAFLVWYVLVGHTGTSSDPITASILLGMPRFVWHQVYTNVGRISSLGLIHAKFLAPVLVIVLLIWLAWRWRRLWRSHAAVIALLVADVVFHVSVALARERLGRAFDPNRYVYPDAVMLLPAFAMMLGWWPRTAHTDRLSHARVTAGLRIGIVVVVLAVTVGNVQQGVDIVHGRTTYVLALRREIIGSAQLLAGGRRAINATPIVASSALSPKYLLSLERRRLLPRLALTRTDRITDETILNLTGRARPLVGGRLEVLRVSGAAAMSAGSGCLALTPHPGARLPRILFKLSGAGRSGAAEISLTTPQTPQVTAFATPGHSVVHGARGAVLPVRRHAKAWWVSDAVAHEHLLIRLPSDRTTFCHLVGRLDGPAIR